MIAREGWPFVIASFAFHLALVSAGVTMGLSVLVLLAVLLLPVTFFIIFFFRDPDRHFESEPNILVSPADGKVLSVTPNSTDAAGFESATKVSIFLSVFDVHVNRLPCNGRIETWQHIDGQFAVAWADKASHLNERTEIVINSESGHRLFLKQIAGMVARRIVCNLSDGQTIKAGDRFGMILFGSRVELYVPDDSELLVKAGDRVKGGETVMGYLPKAETRPAAAEQEGTDAEL